MGFSRQEYWSGVLEGLAQGHGAEKGEGVQTSVWWPWDTGGGARAQRRFTAPIVTVDPGVDGFKAGGAHALPSPHRNCYTTTSPSFFLTPQIFWNGNSFIKKCAFISDLACRQS